MAHKTPSFPQALSQVPLLQEARPAARAALAHRAQYQTKGKGYVLFTKDDIADWFYLIDRGWVKLFTETIDGDEMVLDLLSAHDLIGETSPFYHKTYAVSAEMATGGGYWMFPLRWIEDEIKNHPPFAMAMMRYMAHKKAMRDKHIEHLTLQDAAQRLGCFLLRLLPPGAVMTERARLTLPVDKYLIANYLGMKPETFSRALARLQDELGLDVDGAEITVPRPDRLVTYTCRACSDVYPCRDRVLKVVG